MSKAPAPGYAPDKLIRIGTKADLAKATAEQRSDGVSMHKRMAMGMPAGVKGTMAQRKGFVRTGR